MDDSEEEYLSDDVPDIEANALAALRDGKVTVKNKDGTLRCPYSPSRKKQDYAYKDLCQHADGVAKGKRGPKAAGEHKALCTYLREDLAKLAAPPVERVHKLELVAPQRKVVEDLLVFPWSAVIYNIDNSAKSNDGSSAGPGVADIKQYFAEFNPEKVHICWDRRGHRGMAVVTFRRDLGGLKDAQAVEKWFIEQEHGRKDWEKRRPDRLGSKLYGWLARKEDREGRREVQDDYLLAKYLKEAGDLKDVGMVGEEINKIHDQRFKDLSQKADIKSEAYEKLVEETEITRRNAEEIRLQLEKKHKQELEEVKRKAEQSREEHKKAMQDHDRMVQTSMKALKIRCSELEEKQQHMENEADKLRLEQQKDENKRQLEVVSKQTLMQKKHKADQVKLIKKHEEEDKKLEEWIQHKKLLLAEQQQKELECQRLGEKMDTEKFKEFMESVLPDREDSKNTKELEDRLKNMEHQKLEFEEQLETLKDENEFFSNSVNALTQVQRTVNDELEEARKLALEALKHYGVKGQLHGKRMGEINEEPWQEACRKRFKNHPDGWEIVLKTKFTEWEDLVKDPNFNPFNTVQIDKTDTWKKVVNDKDKDLQTLRNELGDEVYQTVITALAEIEDYNASGRYPVPVVWNFLENRRARVGEVIRALVDRIKSGPPKKKGVKRTIANR